MPRKGSRLPRHLPVGEDDNIGDDRLTQSLEEASKRIDFKSNKDKE